MPAKKKKGMTWEETMKKYGNDVTKIPGWSGRGLDGKVKSKPKAKPTAKPRTKKK